MMSLSEKLFYFCLVIAFGTVSVAFEGTVKVPDTIFWAAVIYLGVAVAVIFFVNVRSERPHPDRGDLDKG